MRLTAGLLFLGLACSASRGEDAPAGRERKVRVALALSAAKEKAVAAKAAPRDKPKAARTAPVRLDWLVESAAESKVEEAPPPKLAADAKTAAAPAPARPKTKPPVPCDARAAAPTADPAASAVVVRGGNAAGSGVVVHCEGGRSLVLTNRHVVEATGPAVVVVCGGKSHPGRLAGVGRPGDVAAVVVDAELPACPLADAEPAAGAELVQYGSPWHAGGRLLPKAGRLLPPRPGVRWDVATTIATESGESGAGVFRGGRVVAVTHGHVGTPEMRGPGLHVRLGTLRVFCASVAAGRFPRLAERLKASAPAPAPAGMPGGPVPADPPTAMPR